MKVRIFFGVAVTLVVLCFCALNNVTAQETFPPLPEALAAMESNWAVNVSTVTVPTWIAPDNYYYVFEPKRTRQNLGFIFYPGAYVDPRSYAPAASKIAEAGYLTVIVKMPQDLAILGIPRAQDILAAYPDTGQWVIGGHSLGGVSATGYVMNHPENMKGVVLWAAYGSDTFTIQDKDVSTLVLFGTNDGLATPAKVQAGNFYLPADTKYVEITGGNHTYFGWYDTSPNALQPGDNPADITREEQQKIIVDETLKLLDGISGRIPCSLTLTPGTISRFLCFLNPFRRFVISGADNATAEVLWSTNAVETISAKPGDNNTIIAWVRVRPFKLKANETYEMAVGDCIGTLTVKPF